MYLNRHVGEPGFTHAERQFLAAVQPYLAHAIGPQAERDGFAMDPEAEREGLVTASLEGEILAMAGEAGPILAEIPEVRDAGRTRAIPGRARLPQALQPVLQALAETAAGRPAPPARLVLKRRWGEFRVRAYPVLSAHGEHSGIVSLILSHHLPREVMMLRRIFGLKLSPMERRVAFLVGEGKSPSEMAAVLGVGEQTLRTYLKTAYARTGSQGRSGLAALVRGE